MMNHLNWKTGRLPASLTRQFNLAHKLEKN